MKKQQYNPFIYQFTIYKVGKQSIDASRCTKLYYNVDNLPLSEMSHAELQIMFYIMFHIGRGKDTISMPTETLIEATGKKRSTILAGIKALTSKEVIQKKSNNIYWVNPHIIFRGNRVSYFENRDKQEGTEMVYVYEKYDKK